jgi:RNA polymerase sigma factor (sigma-70 family)
LEIKELVRLCLRGNPDGERLLYERYVTIMARLCLRYLKDTGETEDALSEGFIKVFDMLRKFDYRGEHSLEAWIKKIMVNECLMRLRKWKSNPFIPFEAVVMEPVHAEDATLPASEIMDLLQALPEGYRTVFNLYAIDGYSHREIAEMLGISESASRSQLTHARNKLKELLSAHGWK